MSAPHAVFTPDIDEAIAEGFARRLTRLENIFFGKYLSDDAQAVDFLGMILVRHTDPDTEGGVSRYKYEAFTPQRRYFYSNDKNLGWLEG